MNQKFSSKGCKQSAWLWAKKKPLDLSGFAVRTGLEPATPCVTGRYSNQLNYRTVSIIKFTFLANCFPYRVCKCRSKNYFVNTLAKKKSKNRRFKRNTLFYCRYFFEIKSSNVSFFNNAPCCILRLPFFRIFFITLHP